MGSFGSKRTRWEEMKVGTEGLGAGSPGTGRGVVGGSSQGSQAPA